MISAVAPINYGNVGGGENSLPVQCNGSYFYARFTGLLVPLATGMYAIGVNCQDGCNLFVGNQEIVSNLMGIDTANSSLEYTQGSTILLTAGIQYPIVIEWAVGVGTNYELEFMWTPPGESTAVLIPATCLTNTYSGISGTLDSSWWNGTAALYYPGGNGTIDFANTQHANKTLDHIPNGGTRVLLTASGSTAKAATAATNLATAPNGDVLTADGAGNVQDSGTLLSSLAFTSSVTSAVAVETARAEAAEALLSPLASPTFTGTVTQANVYVTGTLKDGTGSVGTSGQILSSTGTGTTWLTGGGGGGSSTLAGLTDVDITSPTSGEVLNYDPSSGKWVNAASSSGSLAGDSDVDISSPTAGEILSYNGTYWVNAAPGESNVPVVYGQTVTLSSAITSTTATTFTSPAMSPAPEYIWIDSEQMAVTSIVGTTWTVTRGDNGTIAATHSSGAIVQEMLWSAFNWQSGSMMIVGDGGGGIFTYTPGLSGGQDWVVGVRTLIGVTAPWTVTMQVSLSPAPAADYIGAGISLTQKSAGVKANMFILYQWVNEWYAPNGIQYWPGSGYSSGTASETVLAPFSYNPQSLPTNWWVRFKDDGVAYWTASFSFDGQTFLPVYECNRNADLVADHIGIHVSPRGGANGISCNYYKITTP